MPGLSGFMSIFVREFISKMTGFRDFIIEHGNDSTARLLLSREKWPDIDISLAVNTIESRRKLKDKLPAWYGCPDLIYPNTISAEQCSSAETAALKASIAAGFVHDRAARIADLTGGLGADSCAFRDAGFEVLYNEMDCALCNAARHNLPILGFGDIIICEKEVRPGDISGILGDFAPDIIYLDPARRDSSGKKVFLMEDCRPDILALKDELLGCARLVMVKLSPMADMEMVRSRLGDRCREIHIIASKGDCRELLAILDRDWHGETQFVTWESGGTPFIFTAREKRDATALMPATPDCLTGFLFEPGKAMLKTGAFNLIGERFGLAKLAKSTHLYLLSANNSGDTGPDSSHPGHDGCSTEASIEELLGFGKVFRIIRTLPLSKAGIKDAGKTWTEADVTARNIPMTSDMLRTRLRKESKEQAGKKTLPDNGAQSGKKPLLDNGAQSGMSISGNGTGIIHIFGTRCEFSAGKADNLLIVTEKITRLSDI